MSRVARIVVPGFPHHVTQRGNRRSDVFESDDDRHAYLRFLKQYATRHGVSVWAYCLMSNHIHLVVVPEREDSLAKALRDAHTVYAMRFNTRTRLSGHVWQGRFHSCPMDETHLWAAVRYVERNPVRVGLVAHAEDYPWSSAAAHCRDCPRPCDKGASPGLSLRRPPGAPWQTARDPVLSNEFPPPGIVNDWAEWLRTEDEADDTRIRTCTRVGRPCGSATFLSRLESLLDRGLRPKPRGRRPKQKIIDAQSTGESANS